MATELKIFPIPFEDVLPIEGGRFLIDVSILSTDLYLPHRPHPGVSFKVYDRYRNAGTNAITIHTLCGELINGLPTLVLDGDGDMADIFREDDTDNFIATVGSIFGGSGTVSGGGGGGGGGGLQDIFAGHYGGGLPTDVPDPSLTAAVAYDLDTPGVMYFWNGTAWY